MFASDESLFLDLYIVYQKLFESKQFTSLSRRSEYFPEQDSEYFQIKMLNKKV